MPTWCRTGQPVWAYAQMSQTCPEMPGTTKHPDTSRSIQKHPDTSRPLQAHWEPSRTTRSSIGPCWSTQNLWGCLAILEPSRTPKHRAGTTINGSHPPLNMWQMYVTSPPIGLHQRHPIGLPSSRSGDKNEGCTPGVSRSSWTRVKWKKPEITGVNLIYPNLPQATPKCEPNIQLPLGESVNHDYRIKHQRVPLSPKTI